jgi:hypothetical protein
MNNNEFEKRIESRLVKIYEELYKLYPDETETIAEIEISSLQQIGYDFVCVGIEDENFYALFERKKSD